MEIVSFVLSLVATGGAVISAVLWHAFAPAYGAEKAKNLASKEDLAYLTKIVEQVKATHTSDLERLKASLEDEARATERRRRVYEDTCEALRLFINGHGADENAKRAFHTAYARSWLWASDEVLVKVNHFIILQKTFVTSTGSVSQEQIKSAYTDVVLAMRRNVGLTNTPVQPLAYQFVNFCT